jgi:hypothetical protein
VCFLRGEITKILSFFSPGTPRSKKRKYREDFVAIHKIKPKIITSYNKVMGGIDDAVHSFG